MKITSNRIRTIHLDQTSHNFLSAPRLDVQHALQNEECQWVENLSVHCTWTDEDFIGRCSRISRRTHALTAAPNTIKRALGLYRREKAKEFHTEYLQHLAP